MNITELLKNCSDPDLFTENVLGIFLVLKHLWLLFTLTVKDRLFYVFRIR